MNAKYRIEYMEYEAGWGCKPDGHRDFDSFEDAKKHQIEFNSKNNLKPIPDWYMTASEPFLVDLDRK